MWQVFWIETNPLEHHILTSFYKLLFFSLLELILYFSGHMQSKTAYFLKGVAQR